MHRSHPTRRDVLGSALALGGALAGARVARALPVATTALDRKTRRVVVVAFAGGVRTRETFGSSDNAPNLARIAKEGVYFPRMRTANLGHFGATMSIFTGRSEARGIRENSRGEVPTLFEYLRKDLDLGAGDVWISTTGGAQQSNYSHSVHPEYGARYGANTIDGEGVFNQEFRALLERFGRPRRMEGDEREWLERLRRSIRSDRAAEDARATDDAARIERYILDELSRGTADIRGAGAGDAKALRVARNLISVFKPRVVGVVLQNADIAHGSYNGYAEVIRRNDAAIGELWDAIRADEELAGSTALFVLPEFGRDRDLNSRRGLDHGDGSEDLTRVGGVAWGPDFPGGVTVDRDVATIDVAPTVCALLGAEAKLARGKRLPRLLG